MQPAGNHQMNHQPVIVLEAERDAFPNPFQLHYPLAFQRGDRRKRGPQHEHVRDEDAFENTSHDPTLERLQINRDVRQLRHT
jgi:hypothetical protein